MAIEIKENPTLIKDVLVHEMTKNPLLVPEYAVTFYPLAQEHMPAFAQNYRRAYERGDFFASRYSDPRSQIFNPTWLSQEVSNPNHIWTVFMREGEFIGATGLFYEDGGITSDETQLDIKGRGFGTMKHFLRRVEAVLDNLGVDIAADFLLTPQSKSLRTTLQAEQGMTALGIHPYELVHRKRGNRDSLISGRKYHNLRPQAPIIMPQMTEIYDIVANQVSLPKAQVLDVPANLKFTPRFSQQYEEIKIWGLDPIGQKDALVEGFSPIKYEPRSNTFTMAKFPKEQPDLSFIASEGISANTNLVAYLERIYDMSGEL